MIYAKWPLYDIWYMVLNNGPSCCVLPGDLLFWWWFSMAMRLCWIIKGRMSMSHVQSCHYELFLAQIHIHIYIYTYNYIYVSPEKKWLQIGWIFILPGWSPRSVMLTVSQIMSQRKNPILMYSNPPKDRQVNLATKIYSE